MTYTEKEAKKKWCAFTRVRNSGAAGVASVNRSLDGGHYQQCNCIASSCMSWRWKMRFGADPANPENCAVLEPTHGFCGLAGQPNG